MGLANEIGVKTTAGGTARRVGFLLAVFLLALFVRIAGIRIQPAPFHSTKQYECALRARSHYLASEKHCHEQEALPAARLYFSRFAHSQPGFFIITDLCAWGKQPDLQKFLRETFAIVSEKKEYIIFDLRKKKKSVACFQQR